MTPAPPVLSFCIPTYNFGAFLGEALDSILAQADERVEIVIVDGGSTDQTFDVIAERARRFPRITLFRRETRVGFDRDVLKMVELARGEFCWLFSADDVLLPGAVAKVLARLERSAPDLLLPGFLHCDLRLRSMGPHPILAGGGDAEFALEDPAELARYCRLALTSTAFFTFVSATVVRREAWERAGPVDEYLGGCWVIAAKVLRMRRERLRLVYVAEPLFQNRGDNDSFSADGPLRRLAISLDGFDRLAADYFGEGTEEHLHVRRVLGNEYPLPVLLWLKLRVARGGSAADDAALAALVARHYRGRGLRDRLARVIYRAVPVAALGLAERPVRGVLAWLRERRIARPEDQKSQGTRSWT